MVNGTVSYSTWQSNPSLSYVGRRTSSGAIVTFDQGAKYEVKLVAKVDNFGSSTIVRIRIGSDSGGIVLEVQNVDDDRFLYHTVDNFIVDATTAGTNLWQNQNAGTNAGVDYIVTYRKIASAIVPTVTLQELKHGKN